MIFWKRKRIEKKESLKIEEKRLQERKWQIRLLDSYPATPSQKLQQDFIVHPDLLKASSRGWAYLKKKKDSTITYQKNVWQNRSKKEK